jgi:hypothetical protein
MNTRELELALAAAVPVDRDALQGLDLEAMEAELLADLEGEQLGPSPLGGQAPRRRGRRRLALACGAGLAAVAALVLILATGSSRHASRAYGAELVRFAESSPLLLLDGPGWRVQDVNEERRREGVDGSMSFVTGKPVPYEAITVVPVGQARKPGGFPKAERASGMLPTSVRQRKVELFWRHEDLAAAVEMARRALHPHGQRWVKAPVLDTTAWVDTRAEFFVNLGGPGNRQMTALWAEDGYLLELRAAVPDLAAFEERLDWLTPVDLEDWLAAMPPKVVKAGDHDAVVREMLKGVPVPKSFDPSQVPDEGLTIERSRVAGQVTATVACLWFRQWGEARRSGNPAAEREAEKALTGAPGWPVVRQTQKEGGSAETLLKLAKSIPSGVWQFGPHRYRLLPKAEGLGCARLGLPLLPRKIERQRAHGVPPPPR